MLGCPVQSLLWSRGRPCGVVPVDGPSVFVPCVTVARSLSSFLSCHGKQAISPSDLTILTGVHALASSPLSLVLRGYTGGHRVALAHSSPPCTGGYCCSAHANHY